MPCTEMQELEISNSQYNERSMLTASLLTAGHEDFTKWHRAGRARLAYTIQMHRETCDQCRSHD